MGWRELVALTQESVVRTFSDGQEPERFTYTAAGGQTPVVVSGVFRDPHAFMDMRSEVDLSTTQPTLDVRNAELPVKPRAGDVVEALASRFSGRRWRVTDVVGDGEGMSKLFLVVIT